MNGKKRRILEKLLHPLVDRCLVACYRVYVGDIAPRVEDNNYLTEDAFRLLVHSYLQSEELNMKEGE